MAKHKGCDGILGSTRGPEGRRHEAGAPAQVSLADFLGGAPAESAPVAGGRDGHLAELVAVLDRVDLVFIKVVKTVFLDAVVGNGGRMRRVVR